MMEATWRSLCLPFTTFTPVAAAISPSDRRKSRGTMKHSTSTRYSIIIIRSSSWLPSTFFFFLFFFASLISFDFPTSWLPEALCVGSTGRFRRWNGPERVHLIPSHRPPPSLIAPAAGRRRYAGIPVALPSSGGSPQRLETKDFLLIISRVNSFKEEKVWAGKNSSLFACSTRKNRFSGARQNKHKIRQQKETELEHEARGIWNSGGRNNTAPTESRRGN